MIPTDIDVLITHAPPFGHGDLTREGHFVGCKELMCKVEEIKPRLHIFGLVSEDAGIFFDTDTAFINAAICDRRYRPINKPQLFDLDLKCQRL
jgi:Icc-related predicted phosphoesterase